MTHKNTMKFMQ